MKYNSAIQQVWIDLVAHEKLWAWTRMAKGEVSMLGLVEDGLGGPAITDLFLVRQSCSSASTDMDQDAVGKLLFDLGAAGMEGQLRAWVHSHAAMDVFWSRTDDGTIEGLGGEPYIVSVVVNKKGDVKARLDVFKPVRFVIDDVPVKMRVPDMGLEEQWRREFEEKVAESTMGSLFMMPADNRDQPGLFDARTAEAHAFPDFDDLEAMVRRGEISVDDYFRAVDGDCWVDPVVSGEAADGQRA